MQAHTKKPPTDKLVPLTLMVHPINVDRIRNYVKQIEPEEGDEGSITADEFFDKYFPCESKAGIALRGARKRDGLTQKQLAELTGIDQRHISEMEKGKRGIGKERARKFARVFNADYRVFL